MFFLLEKVVGVCGRLVAVWLFLPEKGEDKQKEGVVYLVIC